ncbi:copper resistance protein B [Stenotrophomonas sp. MMGLT7]|uniref:copper resistance protein B n=1 Tax=Stenotrophomonas sp. MMGLT7 TaxID=2901227 RepID=UPI001E32460B|nr:copper resistance protein B [Stenotrophomonas sp. MMGLT7]MCD7098429.1 copper resistance protein B [Stenotrophomonas sp. MMGLT7]
MKRHADTLAIALLLALGTGTAPSARAQAAPSCTAEHAAMGHCTMPTVPAQADCPPEHAAMGHCTPTPATTHDMQPPAATSHCTAEHAAMGHCTMPTAPAQADCPREHAAMGHCTPGPAAPPAPSEPREPIPALTDADRAAAFPVLNSAHMSHGSSINSLVLLDRLETWDADPGSGQAWEASAWIGGDIDRLWLRSEGERERGRTGAADLEVLYGRSVSAWWDVVAGVRHDFRPGDSRGWAAFGVQGLAPYKFEVSATAYLGESGQAAARVEVEYELLLTNRLILQPRLEASASARDEPRYGNGSGLNSAEAGLRLRYEFSRRFAPYLGVVHERRYGRTADYRRAEGEDPRDTRLVAGVRIWF